VKSAILDRYLVREIRQGMFSVALLLLMVIFTGLLVDVMGRIGRGQLPADLMFSQMALRVPRALNLLLPVAGFLGVILAYTRLYRDSEMAVLRASGYSELNLLRPVLLFSLPLALALAAISLVVAPKAQRIAFAAAENASREMVVAGLEAGRFVEQSNAVIYAGELLPQKAFSDVLIVRELPGDVLQIVRAKGGLVRTKDKDSSSILELASGERSTLKVGENNLERAAFSSAELVLPESMAAKKSPSIEDIASNELANNRLGRSELYYRISVPIMLVMLMLLAPALARSAPRQVRYDRIVIGLLLYMVYSQTLELAKKLYARGRGPEWLGIWWVHALFLLVLVIAHWNQIVVAWHAYRGHYGPQQGNARR
jgi:lipopolysaccharide export system permease protein